jgi:hypothetical protein
MTMVARVFPSGSEEIYTCGLICGRSATDFGVLHNVGSVKYWLILPKASGVTQEIDLACINLLCTIRKKLFLKRLFMKKNLARN